MSNATQRLTEIEAQEKALADEKAKLLKASKKDDLELVKKLCKQHGFTATKSSLINRFSPQRACMGWVRGDETGASGRVSDRQTGVVRRIPLSPP